MTYYTRRRLHVVCKHGDDSHDQSDHGNWARDGGGSGGSREHKERDEFIRERRNKHGRNNYLDPKDPRSESARAERKVSRVRDKAVQVYADANGDPDDFERTEKLRQLDWRDKTKLSVGDARAVMEVATPSGYNNFKVGKVFDALAPYQDKVKIQLAREYSPAMYLYGPDEVLEHIANKVAPRIKADEIGGEEAGALRLWWD